MPWINKWMTMNFDEWNDSFHSRDKEMNMRKEFSFGLVITGESGLCSCHCSCFLCGVRVVLGRRYWLWWIWNSICSNPSLGAWTRTSGTTSMNSVVTFFLIFQTMMKMVHVSWLCIWLPSYNFLFAFHIQSTLVYSFWRLK